MKIFQKQTRKSNVDFCDVDDVAYYILHNEFVKHRIITNQRLNLLLYFVQVAMIEENNKLLFENEFKAYGTPVIPHILRQYRGHGSLYLTPRDILESSVKNAIHNLSDENKEFVKQTLEECSEYSTSRLTNIARSHDPFDKARERYECAKARATHELGVQYSNKSKEQDLDDLSFISNKSLLEYYTLDKGE